MLSKHQNQIFEGLVTIEANWEMEAVEQKGELQTGKAYGG